MSLPNKQSLLQMIEDFLEVYEGFGFCASEEGDALSQWRGYAQGATGFSIGFRKDKLKELCETKHGAEATGRYFSKVNYEEDTQIQELQPTFKKIKEKISEGAFSMPTILTMAVEEDVREADDILRSRNLDAISKYIFMLMNKFFTHKNPAFQEEKEWRVIHHFVKGFEQNVDFRVSENRVVPYAAISFKDQPDIIGEIVIGPKNETPAYVIELILKKFGYFDAHIRKSDATYR